MNLKKISIIALLAVVQAAAVLPAASAASPQQTQTSVSTDAASSLPQESAQDEASKEYADRLAAPTDSTNAAAAETNPAAAAETVQPANTDAEAAESSDPNAADSETPANPATPDESSAAPSSVTPSAAPSTSTSAASPVSNLAASTTGTNKLVLVMNGDKMYQNGQTYTAAQPMTVKNGVSYIAVRSFVNRVGLQLTYDAKTQETIIQKGTDELRFKNGTSTYTVNGVATQMKGASFQQKNTFMVPLTSITQALKIPYQIDYTAKTITLTLSDSPSTTTPPATTTPTAPPVSDLAASTAGTDKLILVMNGDKMYQDGQTYTAAQPMTVKNGVSYIAIRSFVNRVGLKFTYDAKTKETIITKGTDELRFKTGSDSYTVNGVATKMKGASFQQNNTFMVPLTSITQALKIPYKNDYTAKTITLTLSSKPTATFIVSPSKIIAGETQVTYTAKSSSPSGYAIVDERWEGREDVFAEPGTYTVTYSVQDEKGQWSDPYTQTVTVEAPNVPPVALFQTDKDTYRKGEPVTYTDQSYDPDGTLPEANSRTWDNQKGAYFTAGPQTITLTVTDADGATNTVTKQITITNEQLYTQDEYNALFVPIGNKFQFDGSLVPTFRKVSRNDSSEDITLYRSNSPESVFATGKMYEDTIAGKTRFMIHHANYTNQRVIMYVVATNNNTTPATIQTLDSGFGGPSPYATAAGKVSIQRYHQSMANSSVKSTITLQPGESKIILNELNAIPMANKTVISLLADVTASQPITYSTLMIGADVDPYEAAKTLPVAARDGVHNRGTYPYATKIIDVFEPVGGTSDSSKLVLGDNNDDKNTDGYDADLGTPQSNAGNFGVLYRINLNTVMPNTLITFNPRGGKYTGWITVNGKLVELSSQSLGLPGASLNSADEAGVVYRTGAFEESLVLEFTPAPGSNLPVNLIFTQMPTPKS
ncbi:stalk domain-containing protein [Saccharibacillus sp. CPCC 101409]|uniref:copper amine oxidase N-terminal domain-containing protein n=1 Tax=Saccharibacillus sp. CPCC 101409 TaxID=3058041 RepID=UPI002671EB95|nr:stalk domain-containing protein [Saccharibacillus sp. CPCC 101409]MDO3409516.1 stalk domain-containing protein [Saccharibacillus sp. CPCC 101409]